jgi:NADH-quinone oxidoreductase subunit J
MNIVFLSIVLALGIASLTFKKSISSLISFALMMLVLGMYYLFLNEKLLGLFQIFVYAGGISVLMLFGITLIGTEFEKTKKNPWTAFVSFIFFVAITALFFTNHSLLHINEALHVEDRELFTKLYSDFVIIFALIASSLLYGTIKMMKVLKNRRRYDV